MVQMDVDHGRFSFFFMHTSDRLTSTAALFRYIYYNIVGII